MSRPPLDHPAADPNPGAGPTAPRSGAQPVLVFGGLMVMLLALGLYGLLAPIARPSGLPDDPGVNAAREILGGSLPVASHGLYLVTAFGGESPWVADDSLPMERLAAAHARLVRAAEQNTRDLRILAAMAHVQLSARRWVDAERGYRAVLERAPHYGEARLGFGLALASRTGWEGPHGVADEQRALALRAIAQFANVDRDDAAYGAALYDRAVMLWAVGRGHEAAGLLSEALRERPSGLWAERYRALMELRAR